MALGDLGRVAVVVGVGAPQGLGAALARRFAREGLHTFVAGRTRERLEAVAGEIEVAGGRATAVAADATRADDVALLLDIDAIAGAFWSLHVQHPSAWTHELDLRPFNEKF
ncbi:MAG: SDR family NAD(P)-dependent oxidoreductase [Deltaproteobacteria bacterium]|nr:SDR family NAD(P)-dependent oxidoreductase [Deltaproteobacteria bacterium]MBW2422276.1 SDR family NAD(P)-dependent oxidoreductase [Deltaproteobacteria bacterium]